MEQFILFVLVVAILAGGVAFRKLHKALDGYASEKGKNLALKEDLDALTRLVEGVKQQNAVLLEDHRVTNVLRTAALDKRLQAHQEAYTRWRQLHELMKHHDPDLPIKVDECFEWWDENCLYLEPAARKSFVEAAQMALVMYDYREKPPPRDRVFADWKTFVDGGQMLIDAVALPSVAADNPPPPSKK